MNDITNKDIQRNLQFRNVELRSLKILPAFGLAEIEHDL